MALTPLQRDVCRLLADDRKARGESYVAGVHDTEQAVADTWAHDRGLLVRAGFDVDPVRERPAFVEARVRRAGEAVLVEWAQDSAFRFFPLVEHAVLGLTLHPFDLATNKLLALVGRREPRDWIDTLRCHEAVQSLGYLAWAASGKDPGLGPRAILEEAARSVRYTQTELDGLDFEGAPPSAAELSKRWREALAEGRQVVDTLPAEHAGSCVLDEGGALLDAAVAELAQALARGAVRFHRGRIHGAFPELRG
jgi:hypothetical protein